MDTKSKTTLWLLGQSPPLIDCVAEHNFVGAYPPTRGQIILQYFGYHKYHQGNTKLQSSTSESIKLVVQDVQNWWAKTGIPTKTNCAMEKMILHDIDEYKLRKKNKNRKTKTKETKKYQFLCKMKQTFWAVQPSYESQLKKWQQQLKNLLEMEAAGNTRQKA